MAPTVADTVFWLSVVCCVVAQVAIVRSAIRATPYMRAGDEAVPRPRYAVEIAWTVLPALGLALLLVFTWRAMHPAPAPAAPAPVVHARTS